MFSSLEYVILFLPSESLFSSALQLDPSLIELGAKNHIIIATPTTLIAILKAIAFSWKEETISKKAKEISSIGKTLYERIDVMVNHWQKVGKSLSSSVDAYNQALSSLESRVLVSARKLREYHLTNNEEEKVSLEEISKTTRSLFFSSNAVDKK